MQFGRLHGIALLLLALLLLFTQAWITFSVKPAPAPGADFLQPHHQPLTSFIPGILGLVCLGFGGYTLIANRNHPDDQPAHPIK